MSPPADPSPSTTCAGAACWDVLSSPVPILVDLLNATNATSTVDNWNLNPVQWIRFGSGMAIAVATILSFHTMDQHIRYNKDGVMRAYVVRILFMVPIYAISAWLGLVQESFTIWWNVVRDVYEAVTIYSFIRFLAAYLGGKKAVTKLVISRYADGRRLIYHMWPCNKCLRTATNPQRFMANVNTGLMQYVVVQVLTALLTVYLTAVGKCKEGEWTWGNAYPYFVVVRNCCQTWALYDLVWFYRSLHAELAGCNPFPKAMCIKGVVFFTYWQSVLFSILATFGVLDWMSVFGFADPTTALQNFIICFEMLAAAILHAKYFPPEEFNELPPREARASPDLEESLNCSPLVPIPFEAVQADLAPRPRPAPSHDPDDPFPGPRTPSPEFDAPSNPFAGSDCFPGPRTPPPAAFDDPAVFATPPFSALPARHPSPPMFRSEDEPFDDPQEAKLSLVPSVH
jgi:hypothetical protein